MVADERYGQSGSYFSWEGEAGTGGAGGRDATQNTEKAATQRSLRCRCHMKTLLQVTES